MKPFSTVKSFIFSSRSLIKISHFSTTWNQFNSSPSSSYQNRRHEEECRNVRVSVWWDFENCSLPATTNVFRVSQSITAAIRASGIKGPVQITAFGDVLQLSRSNQEALSSTGINLTHIPRGGKNSADRSLLVDLMYWVSQNPPPAHLFLISGDRDFANILHRLRMNNYNILLSSRDTAPGVLCSAASIMWQWSSLLKGENLTGKHFNQPPDGPYGSWYGHYRVPLEDPFAVNEQPAGSPAEELSESGSYPKVRTIPKGVIKQIRHLLSLYPKGIYITELRAELGKSNLSIDRNFYGYKKFSNFLLSMPEILKLESVSNGRYFVRGVSLKVSEPSESSLSTSTGPVTNNGDRDFIDSLKKNGDDEEALSSLSNEMQVKDPLSKSPECSEQVEEPPMKVPDPPPIVEKAKKYEEIESCLSPVKEDDKVGFFNRIWKKWFGGSSSNLTEKVKESEKKCDESTSNEAIIDEKNGKKCEGNDSKSSVDTGFLKNVIRWCRLWRSGLRVDNQIEENSEKMEKMNAGRGKKGIFSKESFWKEMQAFMDTPKGSESVLQSRNRKQMAQNLQKQGPPTLKSLNETDLLHLIDLLILDKKWVAESPSHTFPFKLIGLNGEENSSTNPNPSNRLSSIFSGKSSPFTFRSLPENDAEKKDQIPPQNGISLHSMKSRDEILADCQKLVDEIVKKYPEGFNLGSFRKIFLQKYRYSLDLKTLGYQKLVTLLQIMPGVKIESNYLIPYGKSSNGSQDNADPSAKEISCWGNTVNSDSELPDSLDSQWEKLGPVEQTGHDCETLSDDELSDSEDSVSSIRLEGQVKPRLREEDSSLLKILDSWYSSNEDSNCRRFETDNVNGQVGCLGNGLRPSSSGASMNSGTPLVNNVRKQRPTKSYSFVADQIGDKDNKDKLIGEIFGTLKKSGERSIEAHIRG